MQFVEKKNIGMCFHLTAHTRVTKYKPIYLEPVLKVNCAV